MGEHLPPAFIDQERAVRLDSPARNDQVATRGVLIWDCGHVKTLGYRTEIHPPVALAWLHDEGNHNSTIHVKALSHAPNPVGPNPPVFDGLQTTFAVIGYDPVRPLYVGSVVSDYNLTASSIGSYYILVDEPFGDLVPVPGADRPLSGDWNISVTKSDSGNVSLSVAPTFTQIPTWIPGVTTANPLTMGAHVQVCQPVCDASGQVTNGCPVPGCYRSELIMSVINQILLN
jgi:hypothetical protein